MDPSADTASLLSSLSLASVSGLNDGEAGSSGVQMVESDEEQEEGVSPAFITVVESEEEEEQDVALPGAAAADDGFRTKKRTRENEAGYEEARAAMIRISQSIPDFEEVMANIYKAIFETPLVAMLLSDTYNGGRLRHNMFKLWARIRQLVEDNRGVYATNKQGLKETRRTRRPRLVAIERELKYLRANVIFTNKYLHSDAEDSMNFLIKARESLEQLLNSRSAEEYRQAPSDMDTLSYQVAVIDENVAIAALEEVIRQTGQELDRAKRLKASQQQYLDMQNERIRLREQRAEEKRRARLVAQQSTPPPQEGDGGDSTTDDGGTTEGDDDTEEDSPPDPPAQPDMPDAPAFAPSDPPEETPSELDLPPAMVRPDENDGETPPYDEPRRWTYPPPMAEEEEEDPWANMSDANEETKKDDSPSYFRQEDYEPESQIEEDLWANTSNESEEDEDLSDPAQPASQTQLQPESQLQDNSDEEGQTQLQPESQQGVN